MTSRAVLASLSALLLVGAGASGGLAASACTSWIHLEARYKDTNLYDTRGREECMRDVESQTSRAGYKSSVNVDTLFFWFGDDVVTARCMSRTLVAFASYDYRSRDACPLLNQIKNTLRQQP
jgi:hypothetical protein